MNFVGSSPRGRPGVSGFQGAGGKSGYSGISGFSGFSGFAGGAIPPIPPFTNIAAVWGQFNFNPAGYPAGLGVTFNGSDGDESIQFTEVAPYPLDYVNISPAQLPPYLVNIWVDQNPAVNDLTQQGAARPILDATNEWIAFDGVQTGMAGGLVFGSGLFAFSGTTTATIYILFKAGSLLETSVLLESNSWADNATKIQQLSVRLVAGVFTVQVMNDNAITALANTKIKTISDTNWHLAAITIDTAAAAANQVLLKIDNSATGVTAPISTDLSGLAIGSGEPNVGARANATSLFFTGKMRLGYCRSVADDATAQTAMFNYVTYLQSVSP